MTAEPKDEPHVEQRSRPRDEPNGGSRSNQVELVPEAQVAIIAFFVVMSLSGYAAATYAIDRKAAPPWYFLPVVVSTCALVLISFRVNRFRHGWRKAAERLESLLARLDRILGSPDDRAITLPKPRERTGSGYQVIGTNAVWPRSHAVRVQLMGISSVLFVAWITVYSGGPFDSPAGQILLALPLLSPVVARNGTSVLAVYAYTIIVAVAVDRAVPRDGYHQDRTWLIATVIIVLGFSAVLAARIKRNENRARAQLQQASTSAS